LTEQYQIR